MPLIALVVSTDRRQPARCGPQRARTRLASTPADTTLSPIARFTADNVSVAFHNATGPDDWPGISAAGHAAMRAFASMEPPADSHSGLVVLTRCYFAVPADCRATTSRLCINMSESWPVKRLGCPGSHRLADRCPCGHGRDDHTAHQMAVKRPCGGFFASRHSMRISTACPDDAPASRRGFPYLCPLFAPPLCRVLRWSAANTGPAGSRPEVALMWP
jgi:hypothetical protein